MFFCNDALHSHGDGFGPDEWWKGAVVYQIYPRSFADANGDGIGDIQGIREHIDHLVALGVDAVWLSPFYPSPQVDAGYDVSDYFDLAPEYGSLQDLDALIADLHEAGELEQLAEADGLVTDVDRCGRAHHTSLGREGGA